MFSCLLCCLGLLAGVSAKESVTQHTIAVFEDHDNFLRASPVYAVSWKILEQAIIQQKLPVDVIAMNWNSSLNRLKKGKVDLVFGAFKTPERSKWASFSLPLLPEESAMYALDDHPVNSLSDITDYTQFSVSAIEQSTQLGLARKLGFETIYAASEREKLRDLLFSKRVDFVIAQGSYPIACRQNICVKRFAPLALQFYRIMGTTTPKTSELLTSINKGLQQVAPSQEVIIILNDYNQPENVAAWREKFRKEATK